MKVHGKDMIAYIASSGESYQRIALSTSCDIQVNSDLRDVSSPLIGNGKTYRAGRYSWNISTASLVAHDESTAFYLLDALIQRRELIITCNVERGGVSSRLFGKVYVQSWTEGAPIGQLMSYKVTFAGTGELSHTKTNNTTNE